jgi:uncharacterized protein (DUF1015 family)
MAELRPFRGIRYGPQVIAQGMAAVLCPPYDVISPAEQAALYAASPYNVVRIEYGVVQPDDNDNNNRYTRAASALRDWLASGVLMQEQSPAFYLIRHEFTLGGRRTARRELIAAVHLEEWDSRVIRPHENTLPTPKADRFSLMRATNTNVSPIYSTYPDADGQIARLLDGVEATAPAFDIPNLKGAGFRFWVITDGAVIGDVQRALVESPLHIADGHHRYETALTYQRERRAADPGPTANAAYNYVMMSLTAAEDPGLRILPLHRLVRGLSPALLAALPDLLADQYELRDMPLPEPLALEELLAQEGQRRPTFGLAGLKPDRLLLLQPRDLEGVRRAMPAAWSDALKGLDVALLHHTIIGPVLGYGTPEADQGLLAFSHDTAEALESLKNDEYQVAFLVNSTRPDQVVAVADAGDKMPQKSTFFSPKLPTGLVMHLLEGTR